MLLRLIKASKSQIHQSVEYEWPHWGPKMSQEGYHLREQSVTNLGKNTHYVLVEDDRNDVEGSDEVKDDEELRQICESREKKGVLGACQLMDRKILCTNGDGKIEEIEGSCICSVFVGPEHRGKGYGKKLRDSIFSKIDHELKIPFVHLYSEVNEFYTPPFKLYPSNIAIFSSMTKEESEIYRIPSNFSYLGINLIDQVLAIDRTYSFHLLEKHRDGPAFIVPYYRDLFNYFLARQKAYEDDFKLPHSNIHGAMIIQRLDQDKKKSIHHHNDADKINDKESSDVKLDRASDDEKKDDGCGGCGGCDLNSRDDHDYMFRFTKSYIIWHSDVPAGLLRILRLRGNLDEKAELLQLARKEAFIRKLGKGVYARDHENDLSNLLNLVCHREETDCISAVRSIRPDLIPSNSKWLLNEKFCWS